MRQLLNKLGDFLDAVNDAVAFGCAFAIVLGVIVLVLWFGGRTSGLW